MKTNHRFPVALAFALNAGLFICASAPANIVGINTPGSSSATITFDDTTSLNPSLIFGTTLLSPTVSPWNGASFTLPLTFDGTTGDSAKGNVLGTFIPSSPTYSVSLNSVYLNQLPVNTKSATLNFQFDIEYQLDAGGLPFQSTLFPNFNVSGTVQPGAGSFAAINGAIDYYGVTTAGTVSLLDTVNYFALWNTPGSFNGTAVGIPVNGTTPVLLGGTTLTLIGNVRFIVDPATINAETAVPLPPAAWTGLATLAGLGVVLLFRRRATA
jgi:hypothetical protein